MLFCTYCCFIRLIQPVVEHIIFVQQIIFYFLVCYFWRRFSGKAPFKNKTNRDRPLSGYSFNWPVFWRRFRYSEYWLLSNCVSIFIWR